MVFFFGSGLLGLILLIPMLLIMFSKSGAKYILPMMWVILILDLLCGSILFALIQGGLLGWYYHQRRQLRGGPGSAGSAAGPVPAGSPAGPGPGTQSAGLSGHPAGCQCAGCLRVQAVVNDAARRSSRPGTGQCKCGAPASAHSASGFCPPEPRTPLRYQDTIGGRIVRWIS